MKIKLQHDILDKIKQICEKNPDFESCGFVVEKDCVLHVLEQKNVHPDSKSYFVISPIDFLNIKKDFAIKYVFHSHVNNPNFSDFDVKYQKYYNIDMVIYDISSKTFNFLECK